MGDMDGQPDEGAACDGMEDDVGAAAEQPGDLTDAMLYSATLKVQLWVSPAGHTHGFSARIIGATAFRAAIQRP
ncbi:hypothetical protein MF271_17435 (plasmid) [Deinococcus sp. KNUC1210]|uniref:hypothetical protein n=1 Tax=Deinococcus sp. KNUC1210 TaxID=2917691 RepID=UPI001EF09015|nr:hypothetical protein [Deinococcus sp. KNUC1210]ULH16964.1 hypothetical protein MF271_17435 [Deinococcus sp. KNUC1210]